MCVGYGDVKIGTSQTERLCSWNLEWGTFCWEFL